MTGVPSAIVAVRAVEYLSRMLLSRAEHVRGNAAIALGYLSYNHAGERHLLHKSVSPRTRLAVATCSS